MLPSTLEGFPLAALEAMASGLPVLLSDIPPHRELLSGCTDPAGWLVADKAWPRVLHEVVSADRERLVAMGRSGQEHVGLHYSWDRVAVQTLATYRDAIRIAESGLVG